ncbi:DUF268 domain-containing protein [Lachnospiraceae bacterium ZAX-1]
MKGKNNPMMVQTFKELKTNARQFEAFLEILQPDTPIYIWEASKEGQTLARILSADFKDVTLWDASIQMGQKEKLLDASRDVFIKNLSAEALDAIDRNNSFIINATSSPEIAKGVHGLLANMGFTHICLANQFLLDYLAQKVFSDYEIYNKRNTRTDFAPLEDNMFCIVDDWCSFAGTHMNDTYFVQDLWGARKVFKANPKEHYDIGSRVDGFIAHILSFNMKTTLIDVRPLETYGTENITFMQEDATLLLGIVDRSIESLSALCSLEHFGLGRYGDPVDPQADLKAFKSVQRVLCEGGNAYISLPIAEVNSLQFNAHRIYKPSFVVEQFSDMELIEFSHTSLQGLVKNAPIDYKGDYAFGLFHFRKLKEERT